MSAIRLIRCLLFIWVVAFGTAFAQSFNDGVDAYLNGDYKKAFVIWKPLATGGDAVAMFNIGVLYSQGLGVEQNLEEGVNWYRQSAIKGYAPAQFNLGVAFREGKGIRQSAERASQWFRSAAEQDHRHAQYNLASLYWIGEGVEKDREEAIAWFEKAAKAGDPRAQQILVRIQQPTSDQPQGDATQTLADTQAKENVDATKQDSSTESDSSATESSTLASSTEQSTYTTEKEPDTSQDDVTQAENKAVASVEEAKPAPEQLEGQAQTVTNEESIADKPATDQPESADKAAEQVDQEEQEESDESPTSTQTIAAADTETSALPAEEEVSAKPDNNDDWIEQQPEGNYTIQVFADRGGDSGSSKFIQQHKLQQANRFISADGWNKVVVGSYPSREAANQAVANLPDAVQKQKPWVRPLVDIKREINEVGSQVVSAKAGKVEGNLFAATDDTTSNAANVADKDAEKNMQGEPKEATKTEREETITTAAVQGSSLSDGASENQTGKTSSNNITTEEPLDVSEMTIRQRLDIAHEAFIEHDYLNAHRMWEPLAYAGYAEAQYGLAYLLETGSGIPRSEQDAFEWYRLAAEQGHSQAQFNLGVFYMEGRGVMNNEGLGLYWIQTAADNKEQRAKDYLASHRQKSATE